MEWLSRMNDALTYMEDNLDGELSVDKAAQLACMSKYHFQRMFPFIAGVPLAEYVRRRRLTKAAFDLQNGDKVIDVALRYGYDSPTAFNRAFQSVHGMAPSAAQKPNATLKAYPRISFQITIKGVVEMEYRIAKKEAFRVVGVRDPLNPNEEESFQRVPVFWQETFQSGVIPQITGLMNAEPKGLLGVSTCNGDKEWNYYYIAVATDKEMPEGLFEYTVPEHTWAIFPGSGSPGSIQDLQKRIFAEWLPTSGYEWANAPDVEVYLDNDPSNMKYEVWLPITKS